MQKKMKNVEIEQSGSQSTMCLRDVKPDYNYTIGLPYRKELGLCRNFEKV